MLSKTTMTFCARTAVAVLICILLFGSTPSLIAQSPIGEEPTPDFQDYVNPEETPEPVTAEMEPYGDEIALSSVAAYTVTNWYVSNRIGVGTDAPLHSLDIIPQVDTRWTAEKWRGAVGIGNASAIGWHLNSNGWAFGMGHTYDGFYMFRSTDPLGSVTANATSIIYDFMIDNNGNVGIGTGSPGSRLTVVGGPAWRAGWRKSIQLGTADAIVFPTSAGAVYGIGGNNAGQLSFFAANGTSPDAALTGSMTLDPTGNLRVSGTATMDALQITGGADIAEPFSVSDADAVAPGTVVVIDSEHPGELRISDKAYDRSVAGVISGAGDIDPGIILQESQLAIGGDMYPVALVGRTYVMAVGPIQVGDLLTTSDTPGYAMKVSNYERSQGSILGKAMSALDEGSGLVLVLVTLQ